MKEDPLRDNHLEVCKIFLNERWIRMSEVRPVIKSES
jgi:hypothetical protein